MRKYPKSAEHSKMVQVVTQNTPQFALGDIIKVAESLAMA